MGSITQFMATIYDAETLQTINLWLQYIHLWSRTIKKKKHHVNSEAPYFSVLSEILLLLL